MARVRFTGAKEMQARVRALAGQVPDVVGQALLQEAQIERTESMRRTPVDTGELRASHMVTGPTRRGRTITVDISVGGPAAPYAVAVHEDLEAYHKVGQAKFLQSTLEESRPHMLQRIATRVAELLGTS